MSDTRGHILKTLVHGVLWDMDGVQEWLQRLKEWGVKQAIASSAPMANIDDLVDELGLRTDFEVTVSGARLPAVFLEAAR